jgi:hypothetical protein
MKNILNLAMNKAKGAGMFASRYLPLNWQENLKKTTSEKATGPDEKPTRKPAKVKAATKMVSKGSAKKSGKKSGKKSYPVVTYYIEQGNGFLKLRHPGKRTEMKAVKATKLVKTAKKPSRKARAQAAKAKRCN